MTLQPLSCLGIVCFFVVCVVRGKNSQRAGPECRLSMDIGTCAAAEERFYNDAKTGRCTNITYTGCGGNLNNFLTLSQCNQRCLCALPRRKGSCNLSFQRYFYNQESGTCEKFKFSGCGGNPNNFPSKKECEDLCEVQEREPFACQQRPQVGNCNSKISRFYYDANCNCCRDFIWSGCVGQSGNNFARKKECEGFCATPVQPGTNTTTTPTVTTSSTTSNTNTSPSSPTTTATTTTTTTTTPSTTTASTPTTSTTIGSTTTNVTTTQTTTTTEKIPTAVRCMLQPDKGPCPGSLYRYYYDTQCDCCKIFKYGGCGGNENNFVRYQDCAFKCDNPRFA